MSQTQRGLSVIILVVIITVLVLAGAIYYFQTQKPSSSPLPQIHINKTEVPQSSNSDLSGWKIYTNIEAGFTLKYPDSVLLNADTKGATQSVLFIQADKLTSIPEDLPLNMGRGAAVALKDNIAKGQGDNLVSIGSVHGQTTTTLAQFEVCSVLFSRSLTFFPGDYRVRVTLAGPKSAIMTSMSDFFTTDKANCGDQSIWNQTKMKDFEPTLAKKEGKGAGQTWYDTFEQIIKTVTVTSPSVATSKNDLSTYKNDKYGFQISYPASFKALDSKDDLLAYPKGVLLLYAGGQAYDVIIEVWDTKSEYEKEYEFRLSDVATVVKSKDKFITVFNNTNHPENAAIIASLKFL